MNFMRLIMLMVFFSQNISADLNGTSFVLSDIQCGGENGRIEGLSKTIKFNREYALTKLAMSNCTISIKGNVKKSSGKIELVNGNASCSPKGCIGHYTLWVDSTPIHRSLSCLGEKYSDLRDRYRLQVKKLIQENGNCELVFVQENEVKKSK